MKTVSKYIALLLLGASLSSCDDFLTEVNPNAVTTPTFWTNQAEATQGIAATYSMLQYAAMLGSEESVVSSARTDISNSSPFEITPLSLQNFSYNETNDYLKNKWNQLYTGIFRANQVLTNVPKITMDEDVKATILAEAHFLRGLYYFWLMNTYNEGNVILTTTLPEGIEDYTRPLSPKADIFAQVVSDFEAALNSEALPVRWDDNNRGRVTSGAVRGFMGQLYLYEGEYEKAKNLFKEIIESGDYELAPEIGWNFDIAHEWNSESLFEVNYSDVAKPGMNGYGHDYEKAAEATTRGMVGAPGEVGGWNVTTPTGYITNLFQNDPVDRNNPINDESRIYTKRCEASIFFNGANYPYYAVPATVTWNFGWSAQQSYIKKFFNWDGNAKEDNVNIRSGINERVLRLADVYLMYAECLAQTGGDLEEARTYINKVRYRSGVLQMRADQLDTKEKIMNHLMYVERPLELAWEGHSIRWNDLRRWHIIKEWYVELSERVYTADGADGTYKLINQNADYAKFSEMEEPAKNFEEDNYYFPIPTTETSANPYVNANGSAVE